MPTNASQPTPERDWAAFVQQAANELQNRSVPSSRHNKNAAPKLRWRERGFTGSASYRSGRNIVGMIADKYTGCLTEEEYKAGLKMPRHEAEMRFGHLKER